MHKEALQATIGLTSLEVAREVRADPQLINKTKSSRDGLETGHTETRTNKETNNAENEVNFDKDEFNTSPDLSNSDDVSEKIKLEDLSKLVKDVEVDFIDLDSLEDDEPIILTNQVLLLQSQKHKLESAKDAVEAKATLIKAQPSYPSMEQLTELLELPTKVTENCGEIKELKSVTEALDKFAQSIENASTKTGDHSVPLVGQAGTHPTEGGKNTQKEQKRIEESVKADLAKKEVELGKEELVDL
ncbi:hypothetical protein Tco_0524656 [Tanacetum coccineum]